MKKFYTIASTLMLAMSMALMTACSSENDPVIEEKPVVPEQPSQPAKGARTVTLKASANMGDETRIAIEGVEGKEDAFRFNGWKNGDVVKVLALESDGAEYSEEIPFTYSASTEEFTGSVPTRFELSELKYAYVGGSVKEALLGDYTEDWDYFDISTPIAISDPADCFLFGNVSVDGESISAALLAPYALACVHNNTAEDIEVGQINGADDFWEGYLSYVFDAGSFRFVPDILIPEDGEEPLKYTVPAGKKAYFVIPPYYGDGYNYYGLYDFTHNNTIAVPKKSVTPGKVYKVDCSINKVTSITLNETSISSLGFGYAEVLTATVAPANATDKSVTWSSSDENVAIVEDGQVSAVGPGTAIITATANDGSGVTATCTVTVPSSVVLGKNDWTVSGNTLSAIKDGVSISFTRSVGTFTKDEGTGTVTIPAASSGETMTVTVTPPSGKTVVYVANNAISRTLVGTGPWTLYGVTGGWSTSASSPSLLFFGNSISTDATITVKYQ